MNNHSFSKPVSKSIPCSSWKYAVGFGRFLVVAGLLAVFSACTPENIKVVEVPVETPKCELRDLHQANKFVTEAWAVPDSQFNVGEPLSLQTRVSSPSYMNIFYVSTSCKVTRLLDNEWVSKDETGAIIGFPRRNSGIQMELKPPAGEEAFYFVATRQKLVFLASKDILREANGIASLDMNPEQFYGRLEQARRRINPDEWSITTLRTSVISH